MVWSESQKQMDKQVSNSSLILSYLTHSFPLLRSFSCHVTLRSLCQRLHCENCQQSTEGNPSHPGAHIRSYSLNFTQILFISHDLSLSLYFVHTNLISFPIRPQSLFPHIHRLFLSSNSFECIPMLGRAWCDVMSLHMDNCAITSFEPG